MKLIKLNKRNYEVQKKTNGSQKAKNQYINFQSILIKMLVLTFFFFFFN